MYIFLNIEMPDVTDVVCDVISRGKVQANVFDLYIHCACICICIVHV